jgi:hypothetical protein
MLDSFCARETVTVDMNRREAKWYIFDTSLMGIVRPYPKRGPFKMEDKWGMGPAAVLLMRSLEKGTNAQFVQYETIRKVRSYFSKFRAHGSGRCPRHVHHVGQRGERDHTQFNEHPMVQAVHEGVL